MLFVFIICFALFCEMYLPVFNYMDGRHENGTCTKNGTAGKPRCDYWSTCDAGSADLMPSGRPLAFPLGSLNFGPAFTVLVVLGGAYHISWLLVSIKATRDLIGDYVSQGKDMFFFSAREGKASMAVYAFCCCLCCWRNKKPTPRPFMDTTPSMFAGAYPPHRFVLETVSLALYLTAVLQVLWWYYVGSLLPALFYFYPFWFLLMVVPTLLLLIMLVRNSIWTGYAFAGYDCPYRSLSIFCMLTEPMALNVPETLPKEDSQVTVEKDGLSIRLGTGWSSKSHKVTWISKQQMSTSKQGRFQNETDQDKNDQDDQGVPPGVMIISHVDIQKAEFTIQHPDTDEHYTFLNIRPAKKPRDWCWDFIWRRGGIQSCLHTSVAIVSRYYSELLLVVGCSQSLLLVPEVGLVEDSWEFAWSRQNMNAWTGGCA
jgi:hypothetical protein